MRQRLIRWIVALGVAIVLGASAAMGGGQTSVVYGEETTPTPTPTPEQPDGNPGGSGGGGM